MASEQLHIEDYAIIGDTHTAALVGRNGSIDWLCMPRFDSPACFAALVGHAENGYWRIAPTEACKTSRRYRNGTMILETRFETEGGCVTVVDFMPIRRDGRRNDVVRLVRGERGKVPMAVDLVMRCDYGSVVPWTKATDYGLVMISGPDALQVRTPIDLERVDGGRCARFAVSAGETFTFQLAWYPSHEPEPPLGGTEHLLDETEQWWIAWSERCTYEGPWRDALLRSLLTLKALTYGPTGATVAAATTSLPEKIGGVRNWDYRICWLRDSTFLLYALITSGYKDEARAWRNWLLRALAGEPLQLQIMYGIHGERRLEEVELPNLAGYRGSRPVRIGNAAYGQFQLDVYGEVMNSLYEDRKAGIPPDDEAWKMQRVLIEALESCWDEPDNGIWEVRGPRQHFTHSKLMAWLAVDRAVKSVERHGRTADDPDRWRRLRQRIHEDVCEKGFNRELGSFVQTYGGRELDASLLMMPMVGFLPVDDPRVVGTIEAIQRDLCHDGLVLRYRTETGVDALPPGEGVFLPCSFWLVDCLTMLGRLDEAKQLFERLLGLCNDVGLLAEEYDPSAGRLLGNFPQALSHVALVNSVHNLTAAHGPAEQRSTE